MKQQIINLVALSFTLFILFIIFSANTGRNLIFFRIIDIPFGDKFAHAGLVGMLTFLINLAFQGKTFTFRNYNWLIASFGIFILITIEEFSQIWIPNRNFDLLDLTANYLGIGIASYFILKMKRNKNLIFSNEMG